MKCIIIYECWTLLICVCALSIFVYKIYEIFQRSLSLFNSISWIGHKEQWINMERTVNDKKKTLRANNEYNEINIDSLVDVYNAQCI